MRNLGLSLAVMMFFILGNERVFSGQRYWVSADGNDKNPGSESQPFKTLEQARDTIRAAGARSVENRAIVTIRGGIYPLTKTFELGQRDSFTTYIAASGETVRIIGGMSIPSSAVTAVSDTAILSRVIEKEARGKIRQINLKTLGITHTGELGPRGFRRPYIPSPLEIVIDDQVLQIARWPNVGEPTIPIKTVITKGSVPKKEDYGLIPGTFVYESKRPEKWIQADDLYVSGIFGEEWADDTLKVAKIDTQKGTFTTTLPHLYGFLTSPYTRWVGLNLVEEIDVPGEYYIDKPSGILYFYPPKTYSGKSKIFVSTLDKPMIAIENAEHVTFKNVICEVTRDSVFYIEGGKQHGKELRYLSGESLGSYLQSADQRGWSGSKDHQ